jgi:hypothetical protein
MRMIASSHFPLWRSVSKLDVPFSPKKSAFQILASETIDGRFVKECLKMP